MTQILAILYFLNCHMGSLYAEENPLIEKAPLFLTVGEQRRLPVEGLEKYTLGSELLRATYQKNGLKAVLLLKALAPGKTDLIIFKSDHSTEYHSITISPPSRAQPSSLELAVSSLKEVEIIRAGDQFILRGLILSEPELNRIAALKQNFRNFITDQTEIGSILIEKAFSQLERWSETERIQSKIKKIKIEKTANGIKVSGSINEEADRSFIELEARKIFPLVDLKISALSTDDPTIYFKVFLLELKKNKFGSFGLLWNSSIPSAFRVSPWGIQSALGLEATLQTLEGEGSAKVLSNPELVVRAPGEAELFSGGEVPIHTHTQYSSQVSWKNFGLVLKLKVEQATSEKVRLDLSTEVSHLDSKIGIDELPGLQSNRLRTQIDATFGQPLFLSGLLQEEFKNQSKGLPFLRKIPVLGALFSSEDYLNERSELVAILLPQINPPLAPLHRFDTELPNGKIPIPRNHLSAENIEKIQRSPEYPWNAF